MGLLNVIRRLQEFIVPQDVGYVNKGTWGLPTGAVAAALTTGAATYGAYVELITAANNTVDRWIDKIFMRHDEVAELGTLQIAIGEAGSEVPFITTIVQCATAEDVLIVFLTRPVKVRAGVRISARCWTDTDAGTIDAKINGVTGLGGAN